MIVPVWNVEPWLEQCIDSALGQSIGRDHLEVIAVDDGSTDASGRILDAYAARYPSVRVFHEPNSGAPGRPRNVALGHARGKYVFFLDGDDYLGPEALERLVAMAERNGSDIVLARLVGVEGRQTYRTTGGYRRNQDRASVERVFRSLNVQKLFRRAFLDDAGLRFHESLPKGEDAELMGRAYLVAGTISVLADYDCYFLRSREGSQTRRHHDQVSLVDEIEQLERGRIEVVAGHRRPGIGRDRLVIRHLQKLLQKFDARWLQLPAAERRRAFETGAAIVRRWHSAYLDRALPAWARLRAWCFVNGRQAELEDIVGTRFEVAFRDPVVDRGRAYARYPHFRDGSGIPDRCFDMTREIGPEQVLRRAAILDGALELEGEAYLVRVGGSTRVELRPWPRGEPRTFETRAIQTPHLHDSIVVYPTAGYHASIDLATAGPGGGPLPRGIWAIHLSIGTDGVRGSVPVRVPAAAAGGEPADLRLGGGLRVSATRELRLDRGHPSAAARALERAGSRVRALVGRAVRPLRESPIGSFLSAALRLIRPAVRIG